MTSPPSAGRFAERAVGAAVTSAGTKVSLSGKVLTTVNDLPTTTNSIGQKVKSWSVVEVDPKTRTRAVEEYDLVEPSTSPAATAAGVYLVGLAWSDPVRGTLRFQPSGNGLQILPSPIQQATSGVQYVGIATDPNSLTTLELSRNVTGHKRVDLCGQVVDTWTVSMSGILTSRNAQWRVTWTEQFATAYGAAIVQESLGLVAGDGLPSWSRTLTANSIPKVVS